MTWEDIIKKTPKRVGFWNNANNDYPQFPMPKENAPNYNKEKMVKYLTKGASATIAAYRGISSCRFNCNERLYDNPEKTGGFRYKYNMGSRTLSDGVWVYPEGLQHYVDIHEIELPQEFVAHVESHDYDPLKSWEENHSHLEWKELLGMLLRSENDSNIQLVLRTIIEGGNI
tara:strand:+ start:1480 stop:1995 length:516 start_codon:yes stop_codon:yes gene_type:complete